MIVFWCRNLFVVFFFAAAIKAGIQVGHPSYYKPQKWLTIWFLLNFIKMLHEVLFALLGFTGSIFIQLKDENIEMDLDASMNGPNRDLRFCVNPSIDFLSKAEVDLLN